MLSRIGVDFVLRDLPTNLLLDLVDQARGLFDAQAGPRPHVQPNQAGIHLGKKSRPRKNDEPAGQKAERPGTPLTKTSPVLHDRLQRVAVAIRAVAQTVFRIAPGSGQKTLVGGAVRIMLHVRAADT